MHILGGFARGRKLFSPKGGAVRPALARIRNSVFATLGGCLEGARVLDLYSGMGAFGLEAMSRGASFAHFVDRSLDALRVLERNIALLGVQLRTSYERGDALVVPGALAAGQGPFDIVFLDPPFAAFRSEKDAAAVVERARRLLASDLLSADAVLVLRHPTAWRGTIAGLEPRRTKVYGESTVLFVDAGGGRSGSPPTLTSI
jgi:16S rRNA (guanine966-N2)-methyltransferase